MDASDIPTAPLPVPPSPGGKTGGSRLLTLFRDSPEQGLDTVEFVKVLRRRYRVILACILVMTAISAVVALQLTPRYAAEASVVLDTRKTEVIDLQAVLSGLPADTAVVRSELEILKSSNIAEQVAKKLNLTALPEFNPSLRKPTMFTRLHDGVASLLAAVGPLFGIEPAKPDVDADPAQAALQLAGRILQGKTDVTNDGRSYVLKIRTESEDPKLAAALANGYVDAYLQAQLESKFDAVRRANDWLNEHLTDLRKEVEAADQAVQAFKAAHNLIATQVTGATVTTVTTQQLSELNSQLILAAADRAQKESSLRQIQEQLASGGVDAAAQVLNSPLIQQLRKQETDLVQQEAQLATRYKPAHPAMINIKAQEHDLRQKIQEEINKIVRAMAGDAEAARAREASLRSSLAQLEKSSAVQGENEVKLHELQRQADSTKMLYENFLNRFKQTSAQEDIQQPDAHLVAAARVPTSPSYPRVGLVVGIAFIASVLLGVCAAFGVERLDNCFRTPHQIEKIAQATSLGLVPKLRSREAPQDTIVKQPMGPYSEAIRTIRTALRYSDIDNPPKVVLVTSALPREGKSVTSVSLARSVANSGGRSLLIDCDLRRPSVGQILKAEDRAGVLSLFEPGTEIQKAIQVDQLSGMHFITASAGTSNPQDLLGSKHFRGIIDALRPQYDLIVLDTPPVLAVSDALILSHIADTTVFLVRWGQTPRPVALGALNSFRTNGGHLAGIVLTRVDFRQHATYGYGDAGYYYGSYGSYYAGYKKRYGEG